MGTFYTYSATDIGTTRAKNQDTIGVAVNVHPDLNAALAIICDGVGGLTDGEYASQSTYTRFLEWFQYEFPQLIEDPDFDMVLQNRWTKLVENQNRYLYQYATDRQVQLGTTLTALLLFRGKHYTIQVGDSRAYQVSGRLLQLTEDQSLVAREVRQGILTKEEARHDPRQNILLQSIGYMKHIRPDFKMGYIEPGAGYLICSDGFYHHIEDAEMIMALSQGRIYDTARIRDRIDQMINLVKSRGEKDNISVAFISYQEL